MGDCKESHQNSGDYNTGKALRQAGRILFPAIYLALVVLTILTALRGEFLANADRKLIVAGCAVLPFLAIRVIYTVAVSSASARSHFHDLAPSVWVTAFMIILMEAICIVLHRAAGLLSPKAATTSSHPDENDLERNGKAPADWLIAVRATNGDAHPAQNERLIEKG